jgi:type 1 glutamine amidotransferase
MTGANRHDIQNLQALEDASLAVVFARRRGLEPAKMQLLKNYVASGRPLLGIRTASHAFDPRKAAPKGHVAWEKFDHDVLGGNYKGHYGHFKEGTNISIVTKNAEHPVLRGVAANFNSPSWLYINAPLTAKNAVVLLTGRDPGPKNKEQPVLWQNGTVIYTSLGHWDDWRIPAFDKLVNNAVDFLLKK